MISIMTSDDASDESEFLSALNASLERFVHKALKDEQIECIHTIACHGRDVLAVLPTGLGKSAIRERHISVNFKCCFVWAVQPTPHQKPPQNSSFFVGLQSGTVPSPSSTSETYSLRTKQEGLGGKRGAGVRGTGSRSVENTGSGGKHGVWKTRGLGGKHGV